MDGMPTDYPAAFLATYLVRAFEALVAKQALANFLLHAHFLQNVFALGHEFHMVFLPVAPQLLMAIELPTTQIATAVVGEEGRP